MCKYVKMKKKLAAIGGWIYCLHPTEMDSFLVLMLTVQGSLQVEDLTLSNPGRNVKSVFQK